MYDIIIIGAGPAGISASIYAASRGKNILVIEKEQVGGIISNVSNVTHYTAIIASETGATIASRMKEQALTAGVKIVYETVTNVEIDTSVKKVTTNLNKYLSKKLILANGTTPRCLNIPGETELDGKGMNLNASADGPSYTGRNMYVIGGADGAIKEALYLAQFAKTLTIIHFEDQLGCIAEFKNKLKEKNNIKVMLHSRLHALHGQKQIESLDILDEKDNTVKTITDQGCGIFVYAGSVPNTALYQDLSLEDGYIAVNNKMETSIPGIYAAGDICAKQVRQVATAVSDGAIAAINAAM